jgi:hypothetical protein
MIERAQIYFLIGLEVVTLRMGHLNEDTSNLFELSKVAG